MALKSLPQPWKFSSNFVILLLLLLVSKGTELQAQFVVESLPGFEGNLPITLETGYIGIGESEEIQLFYYFVESERNPKEDPLILWLAGGPGCSGLWTLLDEMGPLRFNYEKSGMEKAVLELNPFSFTKVANIIFLDQPVGGGFSYATTQEAYHTSDTLSARGDYDFLRKWLVDHPKFLHNPLYIGGDSYVGIVVPIIVQEIYEGNEVGKEPWMNIKGYVLGNPTTDTKNDYNSRFVFAHRMALLSDELYESLDRNCHGNYYEVDPKNILCVRDLQEAKMCLAKIDKQQILVPWCEGVDNSLDILISSSLRMPFPCRSEKYDYLSWVDNIEVQEALHVRKGTIIGRWKRCMSDEYLMMFYTFNIENVVNYHKKFTNFNCRALIYNGDHDMMYSYVGTLKWIKSLGLQIQTDWKPWFVSGQTAGYTMEYSKNDYRLTYATVKGAGHTAPEYKPEECFAMVSRWFEDYPL